ESRLDAIYDVARKHRIQAPQLPQLQRDLRVELEGVIGGAGQIEQLREELTVLRNGYQKTAGDLSKRRQQAAQKLQKQVEKQLQALAMSGCRFRIALSPRANDAGDAIPHQHGDEDIEFLISTNPGS